MDRTARNRYINVSKAVERNFYGDWNTTKKVFEAWTAERPTGNPRVVTGDPNNNFKTVSSYFVENGSFLKLKTCTLDIICRNQYFQRLDLPV